MSDDLKTNRIPDYSAQNWFNNLNFGASYPSVVANYSVFNNYYSTPMLYDNFSYQFSPTTNFNFSNYWSLPKFDNFNFNFNLNFFTQNMPKIDFGFSHWFTSPKLSDTTPKTGLFATTDALVKPPKLTKPEALEPDSKVSKIVSKSTGKTLKAVAGKGKWVDIAVHDATIEGTTVHKFGYTTLDNMEPKLKHSLAELTKLADEHGYYLVISDGYRSAAEQTKAKKRKPGLVASADKSLHVHGKAMDLAVYPKGKEYPVDITKLPWFYNHAKNELNLAWGQDWRSKKESWHFELKA